MRYLSKSILLLKISCILAGPTSTQLTTLNQEPSKDNTIRDDSRGGISSTFDVALHNPTLAISTIGAQIEINCPAATLWNQQYTLNSTETPDPDEVEEKWIVSYLQSHPDQTLWELFTHTLYNDIHKWATGEDPIESGADAVVHFVSDVVQNFILMIWAAFKWVVKFPFQPKTEWKQVKGFANELWDGSKLAGGLFMDNAINGLKTIVGGLMLHLLLHPAEFTAESILLVGAGFQVIHGLIHGMQAIAGSLPPIVGNSVMSVLIFIHILDDPLLILTPILTNTAQSVQAIGHAGVTIEEPEDNGGFTSNDGSSSLTLPSDYRIPVSNTCQLLSPDLAAPPLTYEELCLTKDPKNLRKIVFGTTKSSVEMNRIERLEAYKHVRKFWCCYGKGSKVELPLGVLDDLPGREIWEGKSYWNSIDDCDSIYNSTSSLPVPDRLTLGL
ncbi:uncharacterized protein MELLADRAFT_58767 [Melampsora larici-populina 98AG31]|uniref:Secreted protein n=1 Tax=Melampsora larici-populina (strain 98AG31 / pathotype 3-4-7) TaxID=747676 RepID=F4R4S4_MELLP|nr:uncharacterized protein MELLADRAFT_58767 [Melampsora larici-populina 98AG31]EGG12859.1 hypothetical protein MELLADRAFT_58767 [Melampsora larici-populina 98AG31]